MAAFTTIAAGIAAVATVGGLALQAAGVGVQMDAADKQAKASQRAEQLRERQMNLESARQRRQALRNAIRARSVALSASTAAGGTGSSGQAGGLGQITNQGADNVRAVNQAEEVGSGIFRANQDIAAAGGQAAFGQGLSSLGGSLISNSGTIGSIGQYMSGKKG